MNFTDIVNAPKMADIVVIFEAVKPKPKKPGSAHTLIRVFDTGPKIWDRGGDVFGVITLTSSAPPTYELSLTEGPFGKFTGTVAELKAIARVILESSAYYDPANGIKTITHQKCEPIQETDIYKFLDARRSGAISKISKTFKIRPIIGKYQRVDHTDLKSVTNGHWLILLPETCPDFDGFLYAGDIDQPAVDRVISAVGKYKFQTIETVTHETSEAVAEFIPQEGSGRFVTLNTGAVVDLVYLAGIYHMIKKHYPKLGITMMQKSDDRLSPILFFVDGWSTAAVMPIR